MKKVFSIQIICCILSFLPITTIACSKKLDVAQPNKFYYLKDSYHVIPPPDVMDLPATGCISMDNSKKNNKNRTSPTSQGGQCIIPYEKDNCQGLELSLKYQPDARWIYKKINSYYFCSWERFTQRTQETPGVQYILYENIYNKDEVNGKRWTLEPLTELEDIKICTNLNKDADKKLDHVASNRRNCLLLYADKDCEGDMVKLNSTDLNNDLGHIGWDKRASSIKPCGMALQGQITRFRVTSSKEDLNVDDGDFEKILFKEPIYFDNYEGTPTIKNFEGRKILNDKFVFDTIKSLDAFESLQLADNIDLGEDNLCFPPKVGSGCVPSDRVKAELLNAYQLQSGIRYQEGREPWTAELSRSFSREEKIEVRPCLKTTVQSFINVKKNVVIEFELGIQLSGENRGERMRTNELRENLPEGMVYLEDLDEFEIFVKTSGSIEATVGVNVSLDVQRSLDPRCREMRKEATTSISAIKRIAGARPSTTTPIMPPKVSPETTTPIPMSTTDEPRESKDSWDDYPKIINQAGLNSEENEGKVERGSPQQEDLSFEEIFTKYQVYWIVMGILIFK